MSVATEADSGFPLPASGSLDYYMHADWEGSARLETGTDGSLYAATAYSPFGYTYDTAGPGVLDASFTEQRQDIDATHSGGQYSFPMRDENPVQGRWGTPDPAGMAAVDPANPQSWNRYAYVNGQPLTSTDPLGLQGQSVCTNFDGNQINCAIQMERDCSTDTSATDLSPGGVCFSTVMNADRPIMDSYQLCSATGIIGCPSGPGPSSTGGGGGAGGLFGPTDSHATISANNGSVLKCTFAAAFDAGEDITGVSMLPGSSQDDWVWNSNTVGFFYVGSGAAEAPTPLEIAHHAVGAVENSQPIQGVLSKFFSNLGHAVSADEVAHFAGAAGKLLSIVSAAAALSDAAKRYDKCRGN